MATIWRTLGVIGILAVLSIAAAIAFILTGSYPVGADSADGPLDVIAAYVRERSVETADANIHAPPLDGASQVAVGARHYSKMCVGCHLGPGVPNNEMRTGMNPRPPVLANRKHPNFWEDFWIIKHGIKMSAMPAWGLSHSDAEIWPIVAFLQKLPSMSPKQYADMTKAQ